MKTRPIAREVLAIYNVDETCIELVISLPANHPLGPISVESGRKSGIAVEQWRKWKLQLTTFLSHQVAVLLNLLSLLYLNRIWKSTVDFFLEHSSH